MRGIVKPNINRMVSYGAECYVGKEVDIVEIHGSDVTFAIGGVTLSAPAECVEIQREKPVEKPKEAGKRLRAEKVAKAAPAKKPAAKKATGKKG